MLAAAAAACFFTLLFFSHGFSGYDVSPMLDAGWRVLNGQVPGRDFVVTFPPSLYLLTALFFRIFGVSWSSTAMGACCLYALLSVLGVRLGALLAKTRGAQTAILLTSVYVAAQTIPLVSINYLWHSSLAQSFGCYAVFATFAALTGKAQKYVRREALCHLALGCSCLLLSKPNTAYPTVLLCAVAVWRAGVRGRDLAGVAAASAALATAALGPAHVTPWGMLSAYAGLTGRLLPRAFANGILYHLYPRYGMANLLVYAILAPAVFFAGRLAWEQRRELFENTFLLLGVVSIAIALLGMGTNFDFKLTDSPLALLGLAILAATQSSPSVLRFRAGAASLALLLLALYFGATRFRMQIIGDWADDKCPAQVMFRDPFFGRFKACAVVPETLAEVDRTLENARGGRIFFGPSLEFLYPARRITSPLHLPDWWDPGSSYPLSQTSAITRAWEGDGFDLLIFNKEEDRGQLPAGILADLDRNYVFVPGTEWIHIYRRR